MSHFFPLTLVESIRNKKIIPFVGAGVSRAVIKADCGKPLFPSWHELLARASERLNAEGKFEVGNAVKSLLSIPNPDYYYIAKLAKDNLDAVWVSFLKDQFDHQYSTASDDSLCLAKKVWDLNSNLVITTNYDRVLRWSCRNQADLGIWDIEAPAEQSKMMRSGNDRPVLWYLHGNIDNASDIILTPDSYKNLYSSNDAENKYPAAILTLKNILASRSLLFVGFSLQDEAFGLQLKSVCEKLSNTGGPHYALVCKSSIDKVRSYSLRGVELIEFSDYGQPLVDVLNEMVVIASGKQQVDSQSTISADITKVAPVSIITTREVGVGYNDTCDTPPSTNVWVGREHELSLLGDKHTKVAVVTGLGGQGKSSLLSKYVNDSKDIYEFYDWRDCKEESNNLKTHLVGMIERITRGRVLAIDLKEENVESIIRTFVNLTVPLNAVFVFDNIDKYVDVGKMTAVGGMDLLIVSLLKSNSRSRYYFSCRSRLSYDSPAFVLVELSGLTVENAGELFKIRKVSIDFNLLCEVHELTQGHPLWIGLIATQAQKRGASIRVLVHKIRTGKDAGLPNAMLKEIWRMLSKKQQKLLRYLAELVRPESEAHLMDYVSKDINYSQYKKDIAHLKSLDLVVVKSPKNAADTVELHPLIREYVRQQYTQNDRKQYISAILDFVDKYILKLHKEERKSLTNYELQHWYTKVELLINSGDVTESMTALTHISSQMLSEGLSEKYLSMSEKALGLVSWDDISVTETPTLEVTIINTVQVLAQMGRFEDGADLVEKYQLNSKGATATYVGVCQLWSYLYWSQKKYDIAIEWGMRGVETKQNNQLDTGHDCRHQLALSLRDSGKPQDAMKYLMGEQSHEYILDPNKVDVKLGGHYYGNLGRAYYLSGKHENAELCYLKSAWLLERGESDEKAINIGWIGFWLGELFLDLKNYDTAYVCYSRSCSKWKSISPYRALDAEQKMEQIVEHVDPTIKNAEEWIIERRYHELIEKMCKYKPV